MIKKIILLLDKRLIKNTSMILTSQIISSIFLFLASILTVKGIGMETYGFIIIALSYINIFNILFNFQSFNAIIKFGHESLSLNKDEELKTYIKQGFVQDIITALLAFISAFILNSFITNLFNWRIEVQTAITILSITLLFNITGTPVGILRLFNKFSLLSYIDIFSSLVKVVLVLVCIYFKYGFIVYVYVECVSLILSNILQIYFSLKEMRSKFLLSFIKVRFNINNKFLMFNLYNNLVTTLDLPVGELTKILVNQFLGPSSLSAYSLLVKFGNIINIISMPISIVAFSDLSKYIAEHKNERAFKLTYNVVWLSFILGLFIIVIQYIFFPYWSSLILQNSISKNVVLLYFIFITFTASTMMIHQLFIAVNLVKYNVGIILFANIVYMLLIFILLNSFNLGLLGLIISLFLQAIIVIILKVIIIYKNIDVI